MKYCLQSTDIKEEMLFNQVCQQLMTNIFLAMVKAVQCPLTKLESSFWYNVYQFLSSDLFTHLLTLLPTQMQNRRFLASIHTCLTQMFAVLMHESAVKHESTEAVAGYSTLHSTSEIHRFVGYLIKSRIDIVDDALQTKRKTTKKAIKLVR